MLFPYLLFYVCTVYCCLQKMWWGGRELFCSLSHERTLGADNFTVIYCLWSRLLGTVSLMPMTSQFKDLVVTYKNICKHNTYFVVYGLKIVYEISMVPFEIKTNVEHIHNMHLRSLKYLTSFYIYKSCWDESQIITLMSYLWNRNLSRNNGPMWGECHRWISYVKGKWHESFLLWC